MLPLSWVRWQVMTRMWTRRPHRLTLPAAAVGLLLGIGLLLSPWDGLVTVAAYEFRCDIVQ
jgi:hypothetical protein